MKRDRLPNRRPDRHGARNGAEMSEAKCEFLLSSIRLAVRNLRAWEAQLEFINISLRRGIVSYDAAVEELEELGLIAYLPDSAPCVPTDDEVVA